MKEIPLTQGKVAIVDDEDYEWLSQWKWCIDFRGYAIRYDYSTGVQRVVKMHRAILADDLKPGLVCDHVNRDKLDNRRGNLRACTQSENNRNSTSRRGSSSRYIGVSAYRERWKAQIQLSGCKKSLGTFSCEQDAALAYNRAARELFGEFANLNPVKDDGRPLLSVGKPLPSSGFRGVHSCGSRWQAVACVGGKARYLGVFDTPEEASRAHLNAKNTAKNK